MPYSRLGRDLERLLPPEAPQASGGLLAAAFVMLLALFIGWLLR